MSAIPRALPAGAVLPPLVPAKPSKGASTRPATSKGRKRPAKGRQRHGGRFAVLNAFIDVHMGKLSRAPAMAWLVLYRDTKPDGLARTAITDLARRVECDRRSVLRALRVLIDAGLLEVVRRGGFGRGVSAYRVKAG